MVAFDYAVNNEVVFQPKGLLAALLVTIEKQKLRAKSQKN